MTRPIHIIVGSMMGGTEYVAEAAQRVLEDNGYQTTLHLTPNYNDIPQENVIWLVCTSTHGAGDYPDNLQAFIADLNNNAATFTQLSHLTIGVGDTSYDTYCQAAINLNTLLTTKHSTSLFEPLLIDMQQDIDPEALAEEWITQRLTQF